MKTRRRLRVLPLVVVAVAALAVTALVLVLSGGEDEPDAPPRLFSPSSFWNARLPDAAPLDPSSERLVRDLAAEAERESEARSGPWIATDQYSTPLYVVDRDQPTVEVRLNEVPDYGRTLQEAFREVPIPEDARPAAGTDGHMTVWQPSTDRLWEFWQARRTGDGWRASWGGAMRDVSRSQGYFTSESWPGANSRWGASATSLPVIGGTMLIDELRRGRIEHALAVALPTPRAGVWSWPAQRTDGTGGPDDIPEGARLRLDPDLDLSRLDMPRITRTIAQAAQDYGIVVRDKTDQAINFFGEDPLGRKPDPYYGEDGVFDGKWPHDFMNDFPWEHLQVLKMDLCSDPGKECTPP